MAQYIKNRGFHNEYYKKIIKEYLAKNPGASRQDINGLLIDMFPYVLTEKQKKKKVENLLSSLSKKEKSIINRGNSKNPKWELNT